ncbi:putative integral membrane protein (TIGR00698 family) [Paenibacillus cellulosilyticus]|uniref:Putative integral membrane protein (TIGR00698 family) n=1 Tax=Paenibacillus cellulosilyticus TaxID=375489 RepID=A0A2V2Z1M1_9BACL|nr:YeiH family protein [Paenibacillus cellulosilyticus]PWW08742.1 putative integral membrane protein (TIGR00698 family) [Paenibacillus cellulosilyticus]QKS48303.1 YeiH family putative sulfate export transporter [Paenibacillus cellulosilyticus]
MAQTNALALSKRRRADCAQGIALTLLLAVIAKYAAGFPFLSIMGQLVIAIILGIAWRAAFGIPESMMSGVSFSSKKLLRYGIILLGMRLNLADIVHAGPKVLAIAVINIAFTIFAVYGIAKLMKVEKRLALLTACGTAICGAAAVVAISPQIKANDNETAIGAATVAILGTIFTLLYTVMYPILSLTAAGYGIFSGATLHEVAHVIAAAAPAGQDAVDLAVIVKLTRVALLVPVAIIIGIWVSRTERKGNGDGKKASWRSIPIPWFIVGFLLTSAVNTLGIIPAALANQLVLAAYLLIAMAMAGLGLHVDLLSFRRLGMKSFAAGLIGSVLLSGLGYALVTLLHLN